MSISTYRNLWLGLYVASNIIATFIFWTNGTLDGDLIGYPISNIEDLILAAVFVMLSYLLWMGPVFRLFNQISITPLRAPNINSDLLKNWRFMALFVFITQAGYLFYCMYFGVNIAGSKAISESAFRYIFILLVPDWLFIVYYALYRKTPGFKPNLMVYIASNIARGWFGMWLTILFLEGAQRVIDKNLNIRKLLPVLGIAAFCVPFLYQLKLAIRTAQDSSSDIIASLQNVIDSVLDVGWIDSLSDAFYPILMRFQHTANVTGIIEKSHEISRDAGTGFKLFFEEGAPQTILSNLLGEPRLSDIHIELLHYLIPEQLPTEAITNTHTGLVGWFWIAPSLIPVYIFYIFIISWLSIWLSKKAGAAPLLICTTWYVWLTLLMNGWFAAYIDYLQAIVIILILQIISSPMDISRKNSAH